MVKKQAAQPHGIVIEEYPGSTPVFTRSETVFFGMLISVLGLIWLAQEVGWLATNIKVGPLIVIVVGLLMIYSGLKLSD